MLYQQGLVAHLAAIALSLGSPDPRLQTYRHTDIQPADPPSISMGISKGGSSAEQVFLPTHPGHFLKFHATAPDLSSDRLYSDMPRTVPNESRSETTNEPQKLNSFWDSAWKPLSQFLGPISIVFGGTSLVTSLKRRFAIRSLSIGQRALLDSVSNDLAILSKDLAASRRGIWVRNMVRYTIDLTPTLILLIRNKVLSWQTSPLSRLVRGITRAVDPSKPAAPALRDDEFMRSRYGSEYTRLKQTIEESPDNDNLKQGLRLFFFRLYKLDHEIKQLNKSIDKFPRFKFLNKEVREAKQIVKGIESDFHCLAVIVEQTLTQGEGEDLVRNFLVVPSTGHPFQKFLASLLGYELPSADADSLHPTKSNEEDTILGGFLRKVLVWCRKDLNFLGEFSSR